MMNRVAVALGGLAWSTISAAQPADAPSEPTEQTAQPADQTDQTVPSDGAKPLSPEYAPPIPAAASSEVAHRPHGSTKSAAWATTLSLGIPTLGVGAFFAGDLVDRGPVATTLYLTALGAFAAGPTLGSYYAGKPWNAGTKVRLIGAALLGVGGYYWVYTEAGQREVIIGPGSILTLTGVVVYGAGMITELAISVRQVGRHNRASSMQLGVAPLADSGGLLPGLIVVGQY